jgi:hypothetical protein
VVGTRDRAKCDAKSEPRDPPPSTDTLRVSAAADRRRISVGFFERSYVCVRRSLQLPATLVIQPVNASDRGGVDHGD